MSGISIEHMEAAARAWISEVLSDPLPADMSTQVALKDGTRLCALARRMRPNVCPPPSSSHLPFKQMENVASYLNAAKALGVAPSDMFQTVDLFEVGRKATDPLHPLPSLHPWTTDWSHSHILRRTTHSAPPRVPHHPVADLPAPPHLVTRGRARGCGRC